MSGHKRRRLLYQKNIISEFEMKMESRLNTKSSPIPDGQGGEFVKS